MFSWVLVCPHLPLYATQEQLQTQHQVQRPSVAQASPTAPTNESAVLHNKALHHSHWSCLFGQILSDLPLKNICMLPIIRAGRPYSSADSSKLKNQALHPFSPIFLHLSHSRPLTSVYKVSHFGLLLMLFSGETWDSFQGSLDTISLKQHFLALERCSLLCVPQHFVGTFPLVSIPVSFASMIFHNNVSTTRAGLCWVLSPQLTQSFPNRGLLN